MAKKSDLGDITVDWCAAQSLPPIKSVPSAYSPFPELEGYAEMLNSASKRAGVVPRTGCDFCIRPLSRSGHVAALRDWTNAFSVGGVKTVTPGPWYLCDSCTAALGLKQGTASIKLSKVRGYYRENVLPRPREALVDQYGEHAVSKTRTSVDLYGPG